MNLFNLFKLRIGRHSPFFFVVRKKGRVEGYSGGRNYFYGLFLQQLLDLLMDSLSLLFVCWYSSRQRSGEGWRGGW